MRAAASTTKLRVGDRDDLDAPRQATFQLSRIYPSHTWSIGPASNTCGYGGCVNLPRNDLVWTSRTIIYLDDTASAELVAEESDMPATPLKRSGGRRMTICSRTRLLKASVGALFLVAAGFGGDQSCAHTPPRLDQRAALDVRHHADRTAGPRMPNGVGAGLLLEKIAPATVLARAPPTETCRRANRRYRWRGCRESRSSG
jgi:hypothetical protein